MQYRDFSKIFKKIIDVYGEKAYPMERVEIIWQEVRGFSEERFEIIVNELIGKNRFPPLLNEFREASIIQRERRAADEKRDLNKSFENFFGREDTKEMLAMVQKRNARLITQTEFDDYIKLLEKAVDEQDPQAL